ncbi:class I SAM-dependent DNA methyltransferase [Frondihabitans cladoniiphilus]|uniref:SAM-dependent methyltransferase n=1 Tax=Frondihabitans cladoniiphilus TaxID=715785 RepID=A0ABP8VID0_9MICO
MESIADRESSTGDARRHFDATHEAREDPWGATSRWYELRKRAVLLASLPDERYGTALELGCSVGVLTGELALRSDAVVGVDLSERAVERARARLQGRDNVTLEQRDMVESFPAAPTSGFDLVVLSEVAYYLTPADLDRVVTRVDEVLAPGGTLVACHWRYAEGDFRQPADAVHLRLAETSSWTRLVRHEEADFVLEVFSRDDRSVATRTGLR